MTIRKPSEEEIRIIDLFVSRSNLNKFYSAKEDIKAVEEIDKNGSIRINDRSVIASDPVCTGYIKSEKTVENYGPYIEIIMCIDESGLPSELQIYSQDGSIVSSPIFCDEIFFI